MKKIIVYAIALMALFSPLAFATDLTDLNLSGDLTVAGDITATAGTVTVAGDLTVSGTITASGTSYGDAVVFTGTVTMGSAGSGQNLLCYGTDASANMLWSQSVDELIFDAGASAFFGDDDILYLGDGSADADRAFSLYYGSGNLVLIPRATDGWLIGTNTYMVDITHNGTFTVGAADEGHNVQFFGETSASYALWDESADNLILAGSATGLVLRDDVELRLGTGSTDAGDIIIDFTEGATGLTLEVIAASENFALGASSHVLNTTHYGTWTSGINNTGYDYKWFGGTSLAYLLWDEDLDDLLVEGSAAIVVTDDCELRFGDQATPDVYLSWASAGHYDLILATTSTVNFGATGEQANIQHYGTYISGASTDGFDFKWFGGTASAYMLWDENVDDLIFDGAAGIVLGDSNAIAFGDGGGDADRDMVLQYDGGDLELTAKASADGFLIGTNALPINVTHNGTWTVGANNEGHDVKWYGDAAGAYAEWDESGDDFLVEGTAAIVLTDECELRFGDGVANAGDIVIDFTDGTAFAIASVGSAENFLIGAAGYVLNTTHHGTWTSGVSGTGYDYKWFGDTADAYMLWDENVDDLVFDGAAGLDLGDANELRFGDETTGDVIFNWDAAKFEMEGDAAASTWNIGAAGNVFNVTHTGTWTSGVDNTGYDYKWFGASGSAYLLWDEDQDDLTFAGAAAAVFEDDADCRFGTDDDFVFSYDNSDLLLEADSNGDGWLIGTSAKTIAVTHHGLWISGVDNTGYDYKWFGGTSLAYLLWDEDKDDLLIEGAAGILITDECELRFGDGTTNAGDIVIDFTDSATGLTLAVIDTSENFALGATGHVLDTTHFGTWTSGATTDGYDYKWFGNTALTYMLWDESDDALEVGTATNYVSIDDTVGIAMLGTVDDITSVAAGIKFTTNTTKTHKYVNGQFAYVGATEISVAGWGQDVVCESLPAGTAIDTDAAGALTLGVVKSEAADDVVRWAFQIPSTFVDTGTAADLILEIQANETVTGATINVDVYSYGATTPIVEGTYTLGDADGKIWYTLNLGDDADIDADDMLIVELVQDGGDDDYDLYGYRLKYRVGIEGTQ